MNNHKELENFSKEELNDTLVKIEKILISHRTFKNQIIEFLKRENLKVEEMISLNKCFLENQSKIYELEITKNNFEKALESKKS